MKIVQERWRRIEDAISRARKVWMQPHQQDDHANDAENDAQRDDG